ncbi:MAG: UbiX family flavin prenyltransferase [Thermoplasmata archaeon]
MKIVVGITGASGVVYGVSLLNYLRKMADIYLILSDNAKKIIGYEVGKNVIQIKKLAKHSYENDDLFAPIASGSVKFDAMVIAPCSMSTLSKIACGISDNLITRTASVCLKERRKLIIVPRETPLSTIQLKNMTALSEAGALILPAMPAFYPKPKNVDDIINFTVGKILDALEIDHNIYRRWGQSTINKK